MATAINNAFMNISAMPAEDTGTTGLQNPLSGVLLPETYMQRVC